MAALNATPVRDKKVPLSGLNKWQEAPTAKEG
jgi:hypothetical protein